MIGIGLTLAAWTASAAPALDPNTYPELSKEELGQFRFIAKMADQGLDDYSNMEGIDQMGMTAYRYCIAFAGYFLAAEHYYKLSAAPELTQPRIDRLIQKIIQKPVWEFWTMISRGVPTLEPRMDKPYPMNHDPVGLHNIMYSGHVAHVIGLYESLYRDFKWSQPGSIVFTWSDTEKFVYDNRSLNQVLYDQMKNQTPPCIQCEPNACFPECNQHPVLSFMLHDQLHGTHFFDAAPDFFTFFKDVNLIDPVTHETAMLYLIKQKTTVSTQDPRYHNGVDLVITPLVGSRLVNLYSSSANGWTGAFMHAWEPEYIEQHYPYQKERNLKVVNGEARLDQTVWEPELAYGFFAMLAAEVGDFQTRDQLVTYADRHYAPVWKDGTYHYPFSRAKGCNNLTDKLIAIARALPKDGLRNLHQRPFDPAHFSSPRLSGVDFPTVVLRRALYDPAKKALIVTTEPGNAPGGKTSFKLVSLDPGRSYRLTIDGNPADEIKGAAQKEIEVGLDQRHDLVLMEQ
jgi:hypothetical protein